jgi:hypothetical protein
MLVNWIVGLNASRDSDSVHTRIVKLQSTQQFRHNIVEADLVKMFYLVCAFVAGWESGE